MLKLKIKDKIRVLIETLFSALLFGTQTIINYGLFISIMITPLLPYLFFYGGNLEYGGLWKSYIYMYFISNRLIIGRIVSIIGLIILVIAASQWALYHHRGEGLFKKGLYSKVRHPQFTGIITITLGLTIMILSVGYLGIDIPGISPKNLDYLLSPATTLWFLQVLGYMAIALFEERRLSKKYGQEYQEYQQKTAFLFPIKNRTRLPDVIFAVIILAVIFMLLQIIPFQSIGNIIGPLF
jgi:protein-S-isoprenylcysteine O-methyltransferase Ste14